MRLDEVEVPFVVMRLRCFAQDPLKFIEREDFGAEGFRGRKQTAHGQSVNRHVADVKNHPRFTHGVTPARNRALGGGNCPGALPKVV